MQHPNKNNTQLDFSSSIIKYKSESLKKSQKPQKTSLRICIHPIRQKYTFSLTTKYILSEKSIKCNFKNFILICVPGSKLVMFLKHGLFDLDKNKCCGMKEQRSNCDSRLLKDKKANLCYK